MRRSLKSLGTSRMEAVSPLIEALGDIQAKAESARVGAIAEQTKLIYPNPGSQADLFFNVLGLGRGEEVKEIVFPPNRLANVKSILDFEKYELHYPEILNQKIKQYPIDFSGGMKPKARMIYYRAGNGSGKSTMGATLCYAMSVIYPHAKGLIVANTYDQLKQSTLIAYLKFYREHNIPFSPWTGDISSSVRSALSRGELVINGCVHYLRTASNFGGGEGSSQSGRGLEVSHCVADELARQNDDVAFNTIQTRTRIPGIPNIILITSTINTSNPYNFVWQLFDDPDRSESQKKRFVSVPGSSIENWHNLSETYVEDMYLSMTKELFRIEVLGEYVATTEGKVFKYFNRTTHVKPLAWVANASKFISVDFNWNPACAIVGQINNNTMEVVKEFYLPQSDTFLLSEAIAAYLIQHGITDVAVFGDASGIQHTANSQKTNWQIVFEQLKKSNIKARSGIPTANPSIIDSVNAINVAFMQGKTFIDPTCKELIKDYESLEWRGSQLDKRDGARSHLQDCHRYAIWQVYPLLRPSPVAQGNYRT